MRLYLIFLFYFIQYKYLNFQNCANLHFSTHTQKTNSQTTVILLAERKHSHISSLPFQYKQADKKHKSNCKETYAPVEEISPNQIRLLLATDKSFKEAFNLTKTSFPSEPLQFHFLSENYHKPLHATNHPGSSYVSINSNTCYTTKDIHQK